ncbi:tyrosine-type recombinase/integrase [Devosia sp. MC521]|uniref:tyrosine-type recombinase/integrase n=1 Tax=Devosia sp. MC521 TaxID=2759954 RepID=UPI0015FDE59D|nr:tyrosine-type recombinase/integrase [Devosia sp. MC521]MBJ6985921.1 tyrosine-type recombinase/integrase [Devosia sp. MC521]QMW61298.1 tyrosine-type recombinase/integrase [Devosia sp. MC521]
MPKRFRLLDARGLVRISTNIAVASDPRAVLATQRVVALDKELHGYWEMLAKGDLTAAEKYAQARERVRKLGLAYHTSDELMAQGLAAMIERFNVLEQRKTVRDMDEVAAVLGVVPRASVTWSNLLPEIERVNKIHLSTKAPDQVRKWLNPRRLAISNFVDLIGDKQLTETSREDLLSFRNWWIDRVIEEELEIGTANKNISHIMVMFATYCREQQLDLEHLVAHLKLKGEEKRQRPAFSPMHLERVILAPGALDNMNGEQRALLHIISETGLRLSEATNLTENSIVLDHPIPHVKVIAEDRQLKVRTTQREIPLVGIALEACMRFPRGFPRYRHKADTLSATINKYLRDNGLMESDRHSVYGLRHTFKDRLQYTGANAALIDALMGHSGKGPKYGLGAALDQKLACLRQIAVNPMPHAPGKGYRYHEGMMVRSSSGGLVLGG